MSTPSSLGTARWAGLALAFTLATAAAQPAPPAPPAATAIGFSSVAQALAALQAKDGAGAIVTHADGWVVVNEPAAAAQWSFTPAGHEAHPALVRRIIHRDPTGTVNVETSSLCEAPQPACARLLQEFETMNSRITQAVKARGRQGSTQP